MPVPLEASEMAVGDWIEGLGTIKELVEHKDKQGNLLSVDLTFWNGRQEFSVNPDSIHMVEQGGLLDRPPSSTIREGLKIRDI